MMKALKVPGMMCNMCVKRITKGLNDEGIEAIVDLKSKTVSVAENVVEKVIDILDDLGFDVEQ